MRKKRMIRKIKWKEYWKDSKEKKIGWIRLLLPKKKLYNSIISNRSRIVRKIIMWYGDTNNK